MNIKHTSQKNRLLPVILAGVFLFLVTASLFYVERQIDQYDVMSVRESIPIPVFSVPEGIYDQPFELEINAPEGYDIYYTTDGSIPTTRSLRYQKPIHIDPKKNLNRDILYIQTSLRWRPPQGKQNHGIAVRARCFKSGEGYGKTKSVIYSNPTIKQHQGFQVVHILMEADSLFSQERGIYVLGEKYYSKNAMIKIDKNPNTIRWQKYPANYHQRGKDWHRPAEFILLDSLGKTLYQQSIRLSIHGSLSRAYPLKTLRIMSDSINGDPVIHYPFFKELTNDIFKAILLRPSGNDYKETMFKDAAIQQMIKILGFDIQEYAPAVVYINGNYWGIHQIREKLDENYLHYKYGACLDKIHIFDFTRSNKYELKYGDVQSVQSFQELVAYIEENAMTDEKAYQYVDTQMDIDNFIDYMIVKKLFANDDWIDNNVRAYKIEQQTEKMSQNNIEAGKWRWFAYDFDLSMLVSPSMNMFTGHILRHRDLPVASIFLQLLENQEFKEKFLNRYEFIAMNYLTTPYKLQIVEDFEERYQYEMERHIARWRYPENNINWRKNVYKMKTFVHKRLEIVLEQLKEL